jgi:mRNA interferase MazF
LPRCRRGEIWLASLDPVIGSEQGKTRPVLVLQNDVANEYSPVVIVAAISTAVGPKEYPTEVKVHAPEAGLKKDSVILLNQIRTIDNQRLVKQWGEVSQHTMTKVNEALKISLGLVAI